MSWTYYSNMIQELGAGKYLSLSPPKTLPVRDWIFFFMIMIISLFRTQYSPNSQTDFPMVLNYYYRNNLKVRKRETGEILTPKLIERGIRIINEHFLLSFFYQPAAWVRKGCTIIAETKSREERTTKSIANFTYEKAAGVDNVVLEASVVAVVVVGEIF